METIIDVKNLSYKAGQRYLIYNINWQVKKGEHWIVFGMNGCGKTTLLSAIAGFNGYTSGGGDLQGCLDYLPDFKTDSTSSEPAPALLKTKWGKEM